jgi:hypothetical protein
MKTKLILAVDLGSSLWKYFFQFLVDGVPSVAKYGVFCSALQRITSSQYERNQYADKNTSLLLIDGVYWAAGENARDAVTSVNVRSPKCRDAIAKILAVVGQVISENVPDSKPELHIELGVLLPLNEMGDAPELSSRLREELYRFGHNGKQIEFALVDGVHISPEGYGISRMAKQYPSGVAMFGHRDFTWAHVTNESISIADSRTLTGWGMLKLVKQISYTFVDELWAAAAICAAGEGLLDKPLLKVVPSEDLARVKLEILEARELVWSQLWDQLSATSIQTADRVFAAGGNAAFWRPELKRVLGSRLSMGGEAIAVIKAQFPELEKSPLLYRLADCFMFWRTLLDENDLKPCSADLIVVVGGRHKIA